MFYGSLVYHKLSGVVGVIPQWVKDLDLGNVKEQMLLVQAMRQEARDLQYPTLHGMRIFGWLRIFLACQSWGGCGGHVLTLI